jgi:nitrite reductase/ring-hydroxylating ferredoxin subunit
MSGSASPHALGRRRFLGLLAACPLFPACEFAEFFDTEAGPEALFDLADPAFSELQRVGGMACAAAGALEILLIRTDADTIRAYERRCPHSNLDMGPCDGNPLPAVFSVDRGQLTCLWHSSVFNLEGQVVSGPAERPLRAFPVTFDAEAGTGRVLIPQAGPPGAGGPPPGVTG